MIRQKSACQAPASVISRRDVCNIEGTLHNGDFATEAVEDACTARQKAPASGGLLDRGSSARSLSNVVS